MPLPKTNTYTIEDIYSLPEGQRAELIDGKMYMMAPPSTRHQRLISRLHAEIYHYIKEKGGKCEIIPSPFAVFLEDDDKNYVEPDISVICDDTKLDERGCHGAPDWIIEIVSPSSRSMDYGRKQVLYFLNGVQEYWIVDPLKEMVVIYQSANEWMPMLKKFGEVIKAGIYEDLEITLSE